jgi:hypothetical protein
MSWVEVNFNLVRYSPIEGTHYFYDAAYPTAVQFLLNGRWEPWDVRWVVRQAHDPDVKRIAEDAEARLSHDRSSGYVLWPPASSPSEAMSANGHAPTQPTGTSPASIPGNRSSSSPAIQDHSGGSQRTSPLISPTTPYFVSVPRRSPQVQPYTSPYASQAPPQPPVLNSHTSPNIIQSLSHSDPLPETESSNHAINHNRQPSALPPISSLSQDKSPSPLPFAKNRDTKILLSLDGDGVRGLSTLLLIESLVNAVCSRVGRRLDPHQIFDLIGGVSTNGLLAIMIGRLRMRVHRAREAYIDISKTIFMDKLQFFQSLVKPSPTPIERHVLEDSVKALIMKEGQDPEALFFDNRQDSTNV